MPPRIDTIEMSLPTDFIESMEDNNFILSEITDKEGITAKKYILKQKKQGLKSLIINENTQRIKVEVSSKILRENYPLGICISTLEQLFFEISESGIIISKDAIKHAIASRVDIKNDIELNLKPEIYINSLNHLVAPNFAKTLYPNGISFNENIDHTPVRQTYYNKEEEMKRNRQFYKSHPLLINAFDNKLRIESRFAGKATIRKYFGSCNVLDIVNSENINLKILHKLIDKQVFEKTIDIDDMTNAEEKKLGQIYLLFDLYNGNYDKIANHIKSKLGENTKATYQINEAKKYFSLIANSKDDLLKINIEEIKKALSEQN